MPIRLLGRLVTGAAPAGRGTADASRHGDSARAARAHAALAGANKGARYHARRASMSGDSAFRRRC